MAVAATLATLETGTVVLLDCLSLLVSNLLLAVEQQLESKAPVAAGVGSFCIQTHVGYLPLVIPLLVWGVAWLVWSMARAGRLVALARAGLVTAAVLSVLWGELVQPLVADDVTDYYVLHPALPRLYEAWSNIGFGRDGC